MIGTMLGPYEITAKLGEGGMGLVFQARDFQLGREVALKVLPEGFSADPERVARFEREAKLLASLNHPNIAQIYGIETAQNGTRALVMELVEGPTLAERLAQGSLPIDESLSIARQIAGALEEAHEKGIIHRDLKPQNVKASREGKVKVLDFGLAKAMDASVSASTGSPSAADVARSPTLMNSPTLTAAGTQLGVILGTAAYMAPEQARGGAVDKRADIWAFGVVLYELLTGESPFQGEDASDSLAAVIQKEPDLTRVPVEVRRLLSACLEKDPKNRLRDIGDVWRLLDPAPRHAQDEQAASRMPAVPWMIAAAVAIAVAGALAFVHFRETAPEPPLVRFQIPAPEKTTLDDLPPVISPDGRRLAFVARGEDGQARLWVRDFSSLDSRQLAGAAHAGHALAEEHRRHAARDRAVVAPGPAHDLVALELQRAGVDGNLGGKPPERLG